MNRNSLRIVIICAAVSGSSVAQAQVAPGLGYVYPPVVTVGSETPVRLGGYDFTSDMQWFVHSDRVELETDGIPGDYHLAPPPYWVGPRASTTAVPIPREVAGVLRVAPGTPAGLVRWQVANANGSSATAVVYLSEGRFASADGRVAAEAGLLELIENRSRDLPQQLPRLPVAVSGRLSRLTEVDRYRLVAETSGLIALDLMARRLGSDFNGVLKVYDGTGRLIADHADTQGLDTRLAFAAQAGQAYTIQVHDVDFRGHRSYVYRLSVTNGPQVTCTRPAFAQRGSTCDMQFIGLGLVSGQARLESIRQKVTFSDRPELEAETIPLESPQGVVEVTVPLSDHTEVTGPVTDAVNQVDRGWAVTDAFQSGQLECRYPVQLQPDTHWRVGAAGVSRLRSLDVSVAVLDSEGKLLVENDDAGGTSDAQARFTTSSGGPFTLVVRNMGPELSALDSLFRLSLVRESPDFSLTVPQQISVPLGGKTTLTVQAERRGGFDGEIALAIEDLPAGLTAEGEWKIPAGKPQAKLVLSAAENSDVVARTVQLTGTASAGESQLVRTARAIAAGNLCERSLAACGTSKLLLAVTMKPPFEVQIVDRERQRDVHRGTTYLAEVEIVREAGFTGPVQLEMTAKQSRNRQGIRGGIVTVPAGVNRAIYPCFMPEWLGTDLTRRMIIHGVARIPDPQGNLRAVSKAGNARITMIMEGALLKLGIEPIELTARPGSSFEIPVQISRSVELMEPVRVELEIPDELAGLVRCEPLVLTPGTDAGKLSVATRPDETLDGEWRFRISATALKDRKWPVVSETTVPVVFESAAAASLQD